MSMVKHGNTFFSGDQVVRKSDKREGKKLVGRVKDSSAIAGTLHIDWSDGTATDELPADLHSAT